MPTGPTGPSIQSRLMTATPDELAKWWKQAAGIPMPKNKKDITPPEKSYYKDDYPMIKCEACNSEGTVMQSLDGNEFPVPCPQCGGTGEVSSSPKIIIPPDFEVDAAPPIDRFAVIRECFTEAAKELQADIDKQILESLQNYSLIDGVDDLT